MTLEDQKNTATLMEIYCEYEITEMVSLITSYLCRRHGHHWVPDVMMSLKGAVGGPKKGQYEVLEKDNVRS